MHLKVGWDIISEALTIIQDKGIEEDEPSNAIVGFTQALRAELAAHNIWVVALLPTLTDTDMVQILFRSGLSRLQSWGSRNPEFPVNLHQG